MWTYTTPSATPDHADDSQSAIRNSQSRYNGQMTTRQIRRFCELNEQCFQLLKSAVNEMGLSARAHDKILRTARTIADLDASESIDQAHISEAINYRMLDRQMWT